MPPGDVLLRIAPSKSTQILSITVTGTDALVTFDNTTWKRHGNNILTAQYDIVVPANCEYVGIALLPTTHSVDRRLSVGSAILLEVVHWKTYSLDGIRFSGCSQLIKVPNKLPESIKLMESMFRNCTVFNDPSIVEWNTGNVTACSSVFNGAVAFNQPIGSWDVSKVTTFHQMFYRSLAFNQNLNDWTITATNLTDMFFSANSYNQPMDKWDVSSVTNFSQMFTNNTAFNQDISSWNISSATNINRMFSYATAFNQNLSNWVIDKSVSRSDYATGASSWVTANRPTLLT